MGRASKQTASKTRGKKEILRTICVFARKGKVGQLKTYLPAVTLAENCESEAGCR